MSNQTMTKKLTPDDSQLITAYLSKGLSNEEIQEICEYKYTRQQIAAVKAWITMRYGK
jgi:hypothetical protein